MLQILLATQPPRSSRAKICACDQSRPSRADGVGNNPNSVAIVRGAQVAGPYAMPFRIVADRGQVPEYNAQPSSKQRCHVLHDCESWSNHANGSKQFPPESRTFAGKSGTLASKANVLAWETTADNVGINSCMVDGADILEDRDFRPMVGEDFAGAGVDFTERDGSHPGPFKAEGETADAGKEVEDISFILS